MIKYEKTKRTFDIIFSILAMLACMPLFLLISLIVSLSSPGKILYSHKRVGRGGKIFPCYKFRTMFSDADERLEDLLSSDPKLHEEWLASRKLKDDPRITPIGKFLRKASLDELPQFWNVIRGDLSVVGPRPLVPAEVSEYLGNKAEKILSVRPGLTCIWQVSGRNDTSYSTRIQLDETYIDNKSFLLDLKLIARTIPCMIFPKGAY
jgi:exopolysaccharide production protein ExoY